MFRGPGFKANSARALLAVVCIGLAGAAALAGCAANESNDGEERGNGAAIRLEYWTPFSGGDNQFMTEMVERFNAEHPHIRVTQINSRLDDYYSRLRTAILSGSAPDLAIIHTTSLPQFVQNGYIEDITDPALEVGLDWSGLNANILEATIYDGRSYAVPLDTHALVMYYNKTHLQDAGVLDDAGKPIIAPGPEGFVRFLEQIRDRLGEDIAPLAMPSTRIDSVWLWWSLYSQMEGGGVFYNEEGTAAAFNNERALEALRYVYGLYESGLIPPDIADAFKLFIDGKAAVAFIGMWGTGAFENAPDLDFGVVPVPMLYDRPAAWGDSHTLALPTKHGMTDDKRKAALTFSKWMVEHGDLWAQAGHVPSSMRVTASEAFHALEYRSDYAAVANYVSYWPRHVKQWSIVEILIREFEKMIYREQTPEEALRNAEELVNAEMGPEDGDGSHES
jgi:multiple sugar transport system substrate-binding protein